MANYESARRKIDRAKKHITDIERLARALGPDTHSLSIELHPETGQHVVKFTSKALSPEFGLAFGDAVTNLRSALDHAYAAALGEQNSRSGQVFFPIRENRQGLIGSLQKRAKKKPIPNALYALIVDEIKPYELGGHLTISGLNDLANIDKHRLLLATNGLIGVTVSYTHGRATFENCFFGTQAGKDMFLSLGPGGIEFKNEPKPSLAVFISEREPNVFHNKHVVPTLLALADDVAVIVGKIEGAVP